MESSMRFTDHPAYYAPAYRPQFVLRKELAGDRQRTQPVAYSASEVSKRASLTNLRTLIALHDRPFEACELFSVHRRARAWLYILAEP